MNERGERLDIAVVGSGIAGLSCAWLLSQHHHVTLYEANPSLGGHSHTVDAQRPGGSVPVDMGFIVYNEVTYPNLTALFAHLGVPTQASDMSFAVSLDGGGFEYGGHDLPALFAQKANVLRPRFWSMLAQLLWLYQRAPAATRVDPMLTLGEWLDRHHFTRGFQRDHLLPMAAAIWSCPVGAVRAQPAASFFRFCDTHGLVRLTNRPIWRTVSGGSREYVARLAAAIRGEILTGREIVGIRRADDHALVLDAQGGAARFDQVVLATHGDTAMALLLDADDAEREVLGAFRTFANRAVLHGDARLMPKRRATWSSWNFCAAGDATQDPPVVTYWMNRLQRLQGADLFVTLNPRREPAPGLIFDEREFTHPIFDAPALLAQKRIWGLQGARRTWFCGAYLGAGFHEDGVQAGLAVAEMLGGVARPWRVPEPFGRLYLPQTARNMLEAL